MLDNPPKDNPGLRRLLLAKAPGINDGPEVRIEAGRIGPPERLSADHDPSEFDSGEPSLDDWLRRRALNIAP